MEMQNLEEDIRRILSEELKKSSVETKSVSTDAGNNGIFKTVDEAIAAAKEAEDVYIDKPIAFREKVLTAIREGFRPYIETMAKNIKEETGMGTVEAII